VLFWYVVLLFCYCVACYSFCFFFSSRRRHTRFKCDWSSDVCSSDLSSRCGSSMYFSSSSMYFSVRWSCCWRKRSQSYSSQIPSRSPSKLDMIGLNASLGGCAKNFHDLRTCCLQLAIGLETQLAAGRVDIVAFLPA